VDSITTALVSAATSGWACSRARRVDHELPAVKRDGRRNMLQQQGSQPLPAYSDVVEAPKTWEAEQEAQRAAGKGKRGPPAPTAVHRPAGPAVRSKAPKQRGLSASLPYSNDQLC
jgi:hypothetical protein